jgi:hypothetical protein
MSYFAAILGAKKDRRKFQILNQCQYVSGRFTMDFFSPVGSTSKSDALGADPKGE